MRFGRSYNGLFVGLITLDAIYLADGVPNNNQKIVASDCTIAAGGPAANAAATFSYLGNRATLLGVLGTHPIAELIKADLAKCQVVIADLTPTSNQVPPVSSIIVTQSTGERAVISINAVKNQVTSNLVSPDILANNDIVLIDGHQMAVGHAIAQLAKSKNIPVVIDGGSWKPGFENILPFVDYAICSTNFYPPNCNTIAEVFAYLSKFGIANIAITCGEKPIQYLDGDKIKFIKIPPAKVVDTLGAGDIFHGAFCYYIIYASFTNALAAAAKVAANSCQFFGTRLWMEN